MKWNKIREKIDLCIKKKGLEHVDFDYIEIKSNGNAVKITVNRWLGNVLECK